VDISCRTSVSQFLVDIPFHSKPFCLVLFENTGQSSFSRNCNKLDVQHRACVGRSARFGKYSLEDVFHFWHFQLCCVCPHLLHVPRDRWTDPRGSRRYLQAGTCIRCVEDREGCREEDIGGTHAKIERITATSLFASVTDIGRELFSRQRVGLIFTFTLYDEVLVNVSLVCFHVFWVYPCIFIFTPENLLARLRFADISCDCSTWSNGNGSFRLRESVILTPGIDFYFDIDVEDSAYSWGRIR
jgi:hypothetical protein